MRSSSARPRAGLSALRLFHGVALFVAASSAFQNVAAAQVLTRGHTQGGAGATGQRIRAWEPSTLVFHTQASPETAPHAPFDQAAADVPVPGGWLLANPWLSWRFTVELRHVASGRTVELPGYFAGDGEGGATGRVWKAGLNAPNVPGIWECEALLEKGHLLNVAAPGTPGEVVWRQRSVVILLPPRSEPMGFFGRGRLAPEPGSHYLRFDDGDYFLKAGVNSPENFLGYEGFTGFDDLSTDGTGGPPGTRGFRHRYEPHVADWRPGDPDWSANGRAHQGRPVIGALNAVADLGANSLYFLPMNLGGDGRDTHPFLDNSDDGVTGEAPVDPGHARFWSVARMREWRLVLEHAQRRGIMVQLLLAERESGNVNWLGAADSIERRLFHKNLVAMFGDLGALKWNLCEENRAENAAGNSPQFTVSELDTMARWIRAWDVHAHPIAVHTDPNDITLYQQLRDQIAPSDWWLDATSLQVHGGECNGLGGGGACSSWTGGTAGSYGGIVEEARALFLGGGLGRAVVIDLDEQGAPQAGAADTSNGHAALHSDWTADDRRRRVLYDTLLSGGNLEWYFGYHDLVGAAGENGGGDLRVEHFDTRSEILTTTRLLRELLETLPFWLMEPADFSLESGSGGLAEHPLYGRPEVFALPGEVAVVYYPTLANGGGSLDAGRLHLAPAPAGARFRTRWFDAETLTQLGVTHEFNLSGNRRWNVTTHGFTPGIDQDLVALVERIQ